jgi:hypothetical protein
VTCHTQPHDQRSCLGCHGGEFTAHDLMQTREHLRFGHDAHPELVATGKCVRCHSGVARDDTKLRPTMATCLSCHEHADQFAVRDCDACHVNLFEEQTRPASHIIHDGDFLREHGARASSAADLCATCHRESFCTSCHGVTVPGIPSRLTFDDPLRAGMHRAGFRARHAEEARVEPGLCRTCHSETFCQSCHTERGVAGPKGTALNPHPPGWVGFGTANDHGRAARRDPASCASCHSGPGEMLCVSCHRVGGIGGNPHPPSWSSNRSLTELPCRLCHTGPL